jgi:hypothetical protein
MKHSKREKGTGKFQAKRISLKRIKKTLDTDNGKVILITLVIIITIIAAELI